MTDVSQSTEEDVAWSSENSNTDEEDAFGDNPGPAPVSLSFIVKFKIRSWTSVETLKIFTIQVLTSVDFYFIF